MPNAINPVIILHFKKPHSDAINAPNRLKTSSYASFAEMVDF